MLTHCSVDDIVLNIDLAPTFLDMGGVESPPHMDGRSLLPLLQPRRRRQAAARWPDTFLVERFGSTFRSDKSRIVRREQITFYRFLFISKTLHPHWYVGLAPQVEGISIPKTPGWPSRPGVVNANPKALIRLPRRPRPSYSILLDCQRRGLRINHPFLENVKCHLFYLK